MTYYSALHYASKAEKSAREAATYNYKNVITNCITEIPQDIKLELNNGTLILKAGSKVYVPNGFEADGVTPKFDIKIVENDISQTFGSSTDISLLFLKQNNTLAWYSVSASGTTPPTTGVLYNTSLNKVQGYSGGSLNSDNNSFPFCLVTLSNGSVTSIDQTFNGFGYIGSTVFALPGVKGLIPDSRNADGRLKNVEFTTEDVLLYTNTSQYTGRLVLLINHHGVNCWYESTTAGNCEAGYVSFTSGIVTSFNPKLPFHAVDRNDSSWIAGQAMPSGRYIDLTLGASGSTYTAPANGWFTIQMKSNNVGQYLQLFLAGQGLGFEDHSITSGDTAKLTIPVAKGKMIGVNYNFGSGAVLFRFTYAEGEAN